MLRRIIQINEELCNGCGLCVSACHESAIALMNNKAVLTRDDYCDGLGDCMPNCPTNAITFIEKDTLPYDDVAVKANLAMKAQQHVSPHIKTVLSDRTDTTWPIQLQLVSSNAAFFTNADVVIAADCAGFAYPFFRRDFMKNRVVVIACPKLDQFNYIAKLADIIRSNAIRSVTVVRMEVPCCGGLTNIVKQAMTAANVNIPLRIATIAKDGKMLPVE